MEENGDHCTECKTSAFGTFKQYWISRIISSTTLPICICTGELLCDYVAHVNRAKTCIMVCLDFFDYRVSNM